MGHTNSRLWYEMKLVFYHGGWLPLVILPVAVLWLQLTTSFSIDTSERAGKVLEVLLPLVAALSSAPLMNMESQAGFAELRASYAEPWWRLPLDRSLVAALWTLLALGLGGLALLAVGGSLRIGSVLPALSPTLFLLGVSLLAGNLTQNYWAAMGASMGIWFINLAAHTILIKNVITASLFLFAYTWPPEIVAYSVNRRLLVGIGVCWFVLNSSWYWWTQKRGLRLYGSTA